MTGGSPVMCIFMSHQLILQPKFKAPVSLPPVFPKASYHLFMTGCKTNSCSVSLRDAVKPPLSYFLTRIWWVYPRVQESSLILPLLFSPLLSVCLSVCLSVWLLGLHNERLSPWLSPLLHLPVRQWQRRLQHQQGGVSGRWVRVSICLQDCRSDLGALTVLLFLGYWGFNLV